MRDHHFKSGDDIIERVADNGYPAVHNVMGNKPLPKQEEFEKRVKEVESILLRSWDRHGILVLREALNRIERRAERKLSPQLSD